jgi:hypothetical protein
VNVISTGMLVLTVTIAFVGGMVAGMILGPPRRRGR